jgi:predicted transcriptional regulator
MTELPDPTAGLGPLEERALRAVQTRGSATAREAWEELAGGRAYTTVMTTLDRLHRKGRLVREKEGRAWRYALPPSAQEQRRSRAEALAKRLLAEEEGLGLVALVEVASAEELERLRALLQSRTAP